MRLKELHSFLYRQLLAVKY